MSFAVGSLVRARAREWVVLPESTEDLLVLRPLGGTEDETAGVYLPLEPVEPARFDPPSPTEIGDHRSCGLLREAVRLSSRSGAGPFRSFARVAVEPRPYQLVPLLMALKLDPVRLLIADDVGIGKTIEACLVARELLDRGEANRLAVLCPPHLAEQWEAELREKFHIAAELVLPETAARLDRMCAPGESIFDRHPFVVVSMDFIKSDRRRDDFVRSAPELVILDEAHTCAAGFEGRGRHQRHQLVAQLARDQTRHLILVTATPHSGKEESFRSLLAFLRPDFADLPQDLSGPERERDRRLLAAHLVQRRRGDIRHYLKADTPFPERDSKEETYRLTPAYRRFFDRVLKYARETVEDVSGGRRRQRVRWWSAIALLRSVGSSPAAAAATLRERSRCDRAETPEEADELGRRAVFDIDFEESIEGVDISPGGDATEPDETGAKDRRRLLELAREAETLKGEEDAKLLAAARLVNECLDDGFRPILFCRFIHTAEYVAEELRKRLPKGVEVAAVTGAIPSSDREGRVLALARSEKRVLVATDCLSEGINLQEHFDAVIHYDLSWNPTRHEQREGRVDRFNQRSPKVRIITYWGADNPIDGMVLEVLIRKHRKIRTSLGVSVPVPLDTSDVLEAIAEGLLLRRKEPDLEGFLPGLEEYVRPKTTDLHRAWDAAAEREKRSRTMFAQGSIHVEEVERELLEARRAIGSARDVERFVVEALRAHKAVVAEKDGRYRFDLAEVPRALRDAFRDSLGDAKCFDARFELPAGDGVLYLSRTHPIVEALAAHVMETALDPAAGGVARRAGAIITREVERRTTLLLLRFRVRILSRRRGEEHLQLAEECRLLAFAGAPENAEWLEEADAERLLGAEPAANIAADRASEFVRRVLDGFDALRPRIEEEARHRAEAIRDAHRRVREAARIAGVSYDVQPQLPADVLGIYVFLPANGGAAR